MDVLTGEKEAELCSQVKGGVVDVVCLVEVFPKNTILKGDGLKLVYSLTGFVPFWAEDSERGTVIFVREGMQCAQVYPPCKVVRDVVVVRLGCFWLVLVYRSPGSSSAEVGALAALLEWVSRASGGRFLVLGDFNLPGVDWAAGRGGPSCGGPLLRVASRLGWQQAVAGPTRFRGSSFSLLDLVFVSFPYYLGWVEICAPLGKSDHAVLKMDIFPPFFQSVLALREGRRSWAKGDYKKLSGIFSQVDWGRELVERGLDGYWCFLLGVLNRAVRECVPLSPPRARGSGAPWFGSRCAASVGQKRRRWRALLACGSPAARERFARSRAACVARLRAERVAYEKRLVAGSRKCPKVFWGYVRQKLGVKRGIPSLRLGSGREAVSPSEKAEAFSDFFSSVFSTEVGDPPGLPFCGGSILGAFSSPSEEEVRKMLVSLRTGKSPGLDGIEPELLKRAASVLAGPLSLLFSESLSRGRVPSAWREARVAPIHKKGSFSDPANYRPVSLTSVVSKILERWVSGYIEGLLRENSVLGDEQFGFRAGRSAEMQLIDCMSIWVGALDMGLPVDLIYLDLRRAFDTVPHRRLLAKLEACGVRGRALDWVRDFLVGRRQLVMVEGVSSGWRQVVSGVPQGSVLGPLLFLVFISDLAREVDPGSHVRLFADDVKLFRVVKGASDRSALQADLAAVSQWAKKWG